VPTVNPSNIEYASNGVMDHILGYSQPKGRVLDPCSGKGAFCFKIPDDWFKD